MDGAIDRPRLLAGLLRRLGEYSVETFKNRLVLQKTVYLLQAFGIYLGYQFHWYLRGPYSTQLTKDVFSLESDWLRYNQVKFADEATERRLQQFFAFIGDHKRDDLWLETVASAHFLARVHGEKDTSAIFQKIKAKQPHVTRKLYEECWAKLEREQLL
jgi:uncharacterized protein YwgA